MARRAHLARAPPEFALVGDELVAAGAGSNFSGQGQILVGLSSKIVNNGQGPDLTPPLLTAVLLRKSASISVNELLVNSPPPRELAVLLKNCVLKLHQKTF